MPSWSSSALQIKACPLNSSTGSANVKDSRRPQPADISNRRPPLSNVAHLTTVGGLGATRSGRRPLRALRLSCVGRPALHGNCSEARPNWQGEPAFQMC